MHSLSLIMSPRIDVNVKSYQGFISAWLLALGVQVANYRAATSSNLNNKEMKFKIGLCVLKYRLSFHEK